MCRRESMMAEQMYKWTNVLKNDFANLFTITCHTASSTTNKTIRTVETFSADMTFMTFYSFLCTVHNRITHWWCTCALPMHCRPSDNHSDDSLFDAKRRDIENEGKQRGMTHKNTNFSGGAWPKCCGPLSHGQKAIIILAPGWISKDLAGILLSLSCNMLHSISIMRKMIRHLLSLNHTR